MPEKEKNFEKIRPQNTLEFAMANDETTHQRGGLYRSMTPEKSEALSQIVAAGLRDLICADERPSCRKNDLSVIKERTSEYIQSRIREQRLPTVEGWAVALGIGRRTLYDWLRDTRDKETYVFLRQVHDTFSDMHTTAAMGGITNPVSWIFYSKNMFGFVDKTNLSISPERENLLGENVDQKMLEEKYADIVVEETPSGPF